MCGGPEPDINMSAIVFNTKMHKHGEDMLILGRREAIFDLCEGNNKSRMCAK